MESIRLPNLIIFRILSHLPLQSLFKFKCVCKLWSTLLLQPTFLYLHQKNSPLSSIDLDILTQRCIDNPDKWFGFTTVYRSSHYLWLQKKITCYQTSIYRIECNHLQDALLIPSPQNPSVCIALEFVPITFDPCGGFAKLISAYEDGNNNLGFEILSLDVGVTSRWRAIDKVLPLPRDGRMMNSIQFFIRRGVAYCIRFVETTEEIDEIQVDVLDMVNETYIGRTTFPRERFMSTTLHLVDWNGRLSFSQLLKDELHVLVLEDHTKLKWAETKLIIKMQSSMVYPKEELITFHACADVSTLVFIRRDNKGNRFLCFYKINTGELYSSEMYVSTFFNITDAEEVAYVVAEFAFRGAGL